MLKARSRQGIRKKIKALSGMINLYSSLYIYDENFYVLISTNSSLGKQLLSQLEPHECNRTMKPASSLELLVNWAIGELKQDIDFIQYETKASPIADGWSLAINGDKIIRTHLPLIEQMLIINNTPDSFSDGGDYFYRPEAALSRIVEALQQGVSIIDIGAESTRPDAKPIDHEEEIARLTYLVDGISELRKDFDFKLSLDSFRKPTIEKFINQIDIVNDVSGNLDKGLLIQLAKLGKTYICMHSLSIPANRSINLPDTENPIEQLLNWANNKLTVLDELGFNSDSIIIDPGIGFNKTAVQSWYILKNIKMLTRKLDAPIIIGHSRKSFMNRISNAAFIDRDLESAVITGYLSHQLVDYVRVHDFDIYKRICKVDNLLGSNYN